MIPLLALIALTGGYSLLCWIKPFGPCRWCKKTGTRTKWITRKLTICRRCKGSRLRLRYGRHAFNYLAKIHADGTSAQPTAGRTYTP